MWRPLALVLVGAFLLFFNDQGRELGVSLIIDDEGELRFVFLFFALIYWGLNNWHSARLGIYAALENGNLGGGPSASNAGQTEPSSCRGGSSDGSSGRHGRSASARIFSRPSICRWLPGASPTSSRTPSSCCGQRRSPSLPLRPWSTLSIITGSRPNAGARSVFARVASIASRCFLSWSLPALPTCNPSFGQLPLAFPAVWFRFLWGTFTISLSAFALLIRLSFLGRGKPLGPTAR